MEGFLERPIGRTWFRVTGDPGRAPLVALHGGPGSTHNYFAPLERLAGERPIVLYDQIGCGNSDRPTDIEWNVEVFRDEVAAVREQLGLDRIHLLGRDEVDEKALRDLRGVVRISHTTLNGRSFLNLDGFAPAGEWEELAATLVSTQDR